MDSIDNIAAARKNLIETGGRTSQDLGLGRIVGQVLVYLYLQPKECSFELLEQELGLSKASVSIAARQLEALGLIQRVWIKGERKKYYRSAENIASALQQGVLSMLRHKVQYVGDELEKSLQLLEVASVSTNKEELGFMQQRVHRAKKLQERLGAILENPLVRLLAKMNSN